MTRIGFDAKRAFQNRSGLGNYSRFILNSLLDHAPGFSYHAYTPRVDEELRAGIPSAAKLKIHTPPHFIHRGLHPLWRSYFVKSQLRRDGIRLYHGLSNELPGGLSRAGVKSVVTIHDLIFVRFPELYPFLDRRVYLHKSRRAALEADRVVAVSRKTADDIVEFLSVPEDKIEIVYQDCQKFFHRPCPRAFRDQIRDLYQLPERYILSVGTIETRKNQLALVKAYQELYPQDIKLMLVGKATAYKKRIQDFIVRHRLESRIIILPHVPCAHLPVFYQGAELFVYPSVYEGFGIPIVEALHSGVPVVASAGSCFAETGGDAALYADPEDPLDIAEKMRDLLHDSALREKLSSKGFEQVRKFSAETVSGRLEELYRDILGAA